MIIRLLTIYYNYQIDVESFNDLIAVQLKFWLNFCKTNNQLQSILDSHLIFHNHITRQLQATSSAKSCVNRLRQSLDGYHDAEYCNLRYLFGIKKILKYRYQKPELVWLSFCKPFYDLKCFSTATDFECEFPNLISVSLYVAF